MCACNVGMQKVHTLNAQQISQQFFTGKKNATPTTQGILWKCPLDPQAEL